IRNIKVISNYISLLFVSGWISRSDSQTVEVQPGKNATLLCSNFSSFPTHTIWFRLVNQTSPICISSIYNFAQPSVLCNGVEHEKVELTSNISTIFLKIKQVDLSDSGLYFCGYYTNGHPVIVNSTYLKVQGGADETTNLTSLILTAVTVVLTKVIICLVIKMRLQTGTVQELVHLCNSKT
uniref:Immunoglobulin domain-containing protein n=1 Tax=Pundamilia nyererei TaxID=303518 RepID=A0A3B4GS09_9CICH